MTSLRRRLIATAAIAGASFVPATAAHAEWHFTKEGAEKLTRQYVAKHYANTYYEDLGASCDPQGERYDPRFKYHRWKCTWYDGSDDTWGEVLIVGSRPAGRYYAKVLHGARRA
jgi:hypothetical protein